MGRRDQVQDRSALSADTHRNIINPHAVQRPSVVTEVVLDGRIGHLSKENPEIQDYFKTADL